VVSVANLGRQSRQSVDPLNDVIRRQMQRMPRQHTRPEIALRRALHRKGLRFRLQSKDLPGRPDIVLSRVKIAIFVDGCFWHRCAIHYKPPKNNSEWWSAKFAANVQRDRDKDAELVAQGWLPVHVWEHDDPSEAADMLHSLWDDRRRRLQ